MTVIICVAPGLIELAEKLRVAVSAQAVPESSTVTVIGHVTEAPLASVIVTFNGYGPGATPMPMIIDDDVSTISDGLPVIWVIEYGAVPPDTREMTDIVEPAGTVRPVVAQVNGSPAPPHAALVGGLSENEHASPTDALSASVG